MQARFVLLLAAAAALAAAAGVRAQPPAPVDTRACNSFGRPPFIGQYLVFETLPSGVVVWSWKKPPRTGPLVENPDAAFAFNSFSDMAAARMLAQPNYTACSVPEPGEPLNGCQAGDPEDPATGYGAYFWFDMDLEMECPGATPAEIVVYEVNCKISGVANATTPDLWRDMRYNCKVVPTPVLLGCNDTGTLPLCKAGTNHCRLCGGKRICARCDHGYHHMGGACLRKATSKRHDDHRKGYGGRH